MFARNKTMEGRLGHVCPRIQKPQPASFPCWEHFLHPPAKIPPPSS